MADIEEKTAWVEASDGSTLFYRVFNPGRGRLQVVVAHSLGEHSGRYGHVVETLAPLGASVWIHDHRGHGRSQGRRGHVDAFDDYVRDLKIVVDMVRKDSNDRSPVLLLGHSMGGLIALSFARRHPRHIDGLVVSSPLLGVPNPPNPLLRAVVRVLSVLWPTLSLSNRLDPAYISHDSAIVNAYIQNDLVHSRISARWFVHCLSEIEATGASPEAIKNPILMQIAGDDHLVSTPAALDYFAGLSVADKTLCHYENLYHEIYNEKRPDREKVLADLKRWVADRYT